MATMKGRHTRCMVLVLALAALLGFGARAQADEHVAGVIVVRGDALFTMQTEDGSSVIVTLKETTEIKLSDGTRMPASELIPGLRVKVEGFYDNGNRLSADQVKFSESDRKLAQAIKAGLTPTDQQVARNAVDIQQHGVSISQHGQTLQQHGRDLTDQDLRIVATTGAIDTTNGRIANIDDYNVVEQFTVLFENGRAKVAPEFQTKLVDLANRSKQLHAYVLQVQGYASAVGSRDVNEMLSRQRADAVTSVLEQHGGIPPTNILSPAAMGISEQVADNATKDGQAQNRRVVVTVLQNKGIANR